MNHTSIPTLDQILNAPDDQWQALARLADADPAYIERQRARIAADEPTTGKAKRRNRRRSSASNGTIKRNWRASQVIAQAMAEAVDRANEADDKANEPAQKMTGFQGLAAARFGDEDQCRKYVGDLGRASYFYLTKPNLAIHILGKWARFIPELFVWSGNNVIDIAWKSERLQERAF
jgi:hypothetical protein